MPPPDRSRATHGRGAGEPRTPLTIPRAVWSPPVPEAAWTDTRPRLPRTAVTTPLAALVLAYLSARTAGAHHPTGAGVLLFAAFDALVWLGATLTRFAYRSLRYYRELPR